MAVLVSCLIQSTAIIAQEYTVKLHSVDNRPDLQQFIAVPSGTLSSQQAFDFLQSLVPDMQAKGFLAASLDSVAIERNVYHLFVYLGNRYRWAHINFDGVQEGVLLQAVMNKKQWEDRWIQPGQIAGVSEQILTWCERNGYPFARVWMEEIRVDSGGRVEGMLILDKGALQKIDTVQVYGEVKVSRNYLLNYLNIRQGMLYDEKKLSTLSNRLNELPFLQEAAPWAVQFKIDGNSLDLYLKEKKANQLNALIGLLPNSAETGKFLLTADAQLAFQNILGAGESISASYQNLQYRSPRFKTDIVYPFLFNTPLGAEAHFDLFKKDTSFRRTTLQLGVRYQLNATDYIKLFYQNQSNRLIYIDTTQVRATKKLPDNADVAANGGGVELVFNRTDYRLNPRKGLEVRLVSSALLRQVRKIDAITELQDGSGFDYSSLYDTITRRQYQFLISSTLGYYFPLSKNLVLKTAYNGGWISGQYLFRNELYQIGGFRLLRGFDEQSIFTNQYHLLTLEMRVLLSRNAYFALFSDNGYVESSFSGFHKDDIYNGFGAGATLETKSGLFTIDYALGRNNNNPVQFRQSKIHFGYVAYF